MKPNNSDIKKGIASWRDWPLVIKVLVILAAALRLIFLEWKAPHFDEGINGHFVMQTWNNGYFDYDPSNYHGPLYFYYLQLSEIIFGRGIFAFRFATGLLASLTVVVTAMHARFVGRAAYWAAAVIALSPAFVFYGRYAIHETLLILCQMFFTYGFLSRYAQPAGSRGSTGIAFMTVGIFGSFATKETFFIFLGCWFIALGLTKLFDRILPKGLRSKGLHFEGRQTQSGGPAEPSANLRTASLRNWGPYVAGGVFVSFALFSGFFIDSQGIWDMFRAFAFWTKTGTGHTGHEKEWWYWLELMKIYEWPLLLAVTLSVPLAFFGSFWMRVFSACGFGLVLAYSIIPYKTPWCLIGFWPLAFAVGFIVLEAPRSTWRLALRGIVAAAIIVSSGFMYRINFVEYHNPKEKYVYVQSTNDLNVVSRKIAERIKLAPQDAAMTIKVWLQDTWPLPWLFSKYPNVQYVKYSEGAKADAEVILIDGVDQQAVETILQKEFVRIPFQIRDAYHGGFAYFDKERFGSLIPEGIPVGKTQEAK